MAQIHAKRHVRLALFGCVRCGRFLFAPSWYELDRDVAVCTCDASKYKMTNVRAPHHVQVYWDAQCKAAYTSHQRRLKRNAPPSVHAERLASDALGWSVISDDEIVNDAIFGRAVSALSVSTPGSTAKPTSFQRQTVSILHACRSALISGLGRVADVRRENKGKAS